MRVPIACAEGPPSPAELAAPTGDTLIPDLLKTAPQTRAVLDRYGLRGCGGPNGPVESLAFFARAHAVDEEVLLREVREAAAHATAPWRTRCCGARWRGATPSARRAAASALTRTSSWQL